MASAEGGALRAWLWLWLRPSPARALAIGLALVLAWCGWRVAEHVSHDFPWQHTYVDAHRRQIAAAAPQALVVGGSNAVYGLSAGALSQATGLRWYNASLLAEGHSWAAYTAFLDDLAQRIDASRVRQVVYSSVYPLMAGEQARREAAGADLFGDEPMTIKPRRSVLTALRHWDDPDAGRTVADGPPPDALGDFAFERFTCHAPRGDVAPLRDESPDAVAAQAARAVTWLHARFPNARITVLVPSAWQGDAAASRPDASAAADAAMMARIDRLLGPGTSAQAYRFVTQPPLASAGLVCDLPYHPNAAGRVVRSTDLAGRIGR